MDEASKGKGLHGLMPLVSCTLHVIDNGFRKGLKVYGNEAEELTSTTVLGLPMQKGGFPKTGE